MGNFMESVLLITYFLALCVLFAFGLHGLVMIYFWHKTQKIVHEKPSELTDEELPLVTVQLPFYNELYFIECSANLLPSLSIKIA